MGNAMASYMIGYNLNAPSKDYSELIEAIEALSEQRWHCLDSTWIIKHEGPAKVIRDALRPHVDSNDELLVAGLTGEGAWAGFGNDCSSWLKDNL